MTCLDHVGAADELACKLPALAFGPFEVDADPLGRVCQVALERVEDHGLRASGMEGEQPATAIGSQTATANGMEADSTMLWGFGSGRAQNGPLQSFRH
jgi:hypothetical protein